MRKRHRMLQAVLLAGILLLSPAAGEAAAGPAVADEKAVLEEARAIVDAYPDAKLSVRWNPEKQGYCLYARADQCILYMDAFSCPPAAPDDKEDAPLCATLAQPYPTGAGGRHPEAGFEPGRVRNEALLKLLYGKDRQEVEASLVPVQFFGETWRFSSRHGAADALRRVAARLEKAAADDPSLKAYILPGGGTYAWRNIANSHRLSAHSFGICIDLNVERGLYWQWKPAPETLQATRRDYPQAIVDAFEAEGFIWGGKWHSFDFMHFEYRPELFPKRPEGR